MKIKVQELINLLNEFPPDALVTLDTYQIIVSSRLKIFEKDGTEHTLEDTFKDTAYPERRKNEDRIHSNMSCSRHRD